MKKLIITILACVLALMTAAAQDMNTAYFLDNNIYSYRINPSIPSEKGFVGIGVSNLNVTACTNMALSSFLFPKAGGGLVTGLNSSVSAESFLGGLKERNLVNQSLNTNIFAFGFWTKSAFHNVELNVRENISAIIPKDIFAIAKNGSSDTAYDLSPTAASAKAYLELAYGYSRKINKEFSVGGRVKFLLGAMGATAQCSKADVTVNGDQVSYDMNAKLRMTSNYIGIKEGSDNILDFRAIDILSNMNPCGFGAALDLGVTYRPIKGLDVNLAILDFGFMGWKYKQLAQAVGKDSFTGITVSVDGTVSDELKAFGEKLEKLAEFQQVEGSESETEMLSCTINLGARYRMPFYDRLSAGLIFAYRFDKYAPCFTGRLGVTVTPVDWCSITGNYGFNSYCATYGVAISLNAANINFLFGYEGYSGKTTKITLSDGFKNASVPLSSFMSQMKLGINITFGKRRSAIKPLNSTSFIHGKRYEEAASTTEADSSEQDKTKE